MHTDPLAALTTTSRWCRRPATVNRVGAPTTSKVMPRQMIVVVAVISWPARSLGNVTR